MFVLKPKANLNGTKLKKWYRRVYRSLGRFGYLPPQWYDHPGVHVDGTMLSCVLNELYKPTSF